MARNSRDRQWLELHGGTWRVTVAVPRKLRPVLGTRLKKSLHTDSLSEANRVKHAVVHELQARIRRNGGGAPPTPHDIVLEAVQFRKILNETGDGPASDDVLREMRRRGEEIIGPDVGVVHDEETGAAHPIHDRGRLAAARDFVAIATGKATPFQEPHDRFLAQSHVTIRTRGDDVRAVKYLTDWCRKNGVPATVEAITRKVAVRFRADLPSVVGRPLDPVTLKKYLNRLSLFWTFMLDEEDVETNVWAGVKLKTNPKPHDEQERAFTDEEMRLLLIGGAPAKMLDVILIGALTGARLDAVVDLRVRDISNSTFHFKQQKKEPAPRYVPIHPDLEELVTRRVAGKRPDDDFFREWPAPKKIGSQRERSFKTSNFFTAYRRKCGVDDRVAGQRRSLVNFHSFRRWFITKAEQAGFDKDLVAAIVGHKREGMTFGRYSEGPEMKRARRCVAAVKLPPLDRGPVKQPQALMPRKKATMKG